MSPCSSGALWSSLAAANISYVAGAALRAGRHVEFGMTEALDRLCEAMDAEAATDALRRHGLVFSRGWWGGSCELGGLLADGIKV